MFHVIPPEKKKLKKLEKTTFSKESLYERSHLQEWLVNRLEEEAVEETGEKEGILGEKLLVLQKEYELPEAHRRLDILALDKDGRLVVIENKLDSGSDAVWQILTYVAMIAEMTMKDIVYIYEKYLNAVNAEPPNAHDRICKFLGLEELNEDVTLNEGNTQRLFLIASEFQKAVTSNILWLGSHKIDARCFEVVLHKFGEELLVNVQRIIPPPKAEDYMFRMAKKETEEEEIKKREKIRHEYWKKLLGALKDKEISLYDGVSPSFNHYLSTGAGTQGCTYRMIFTTGDIRVEFQLDKPDQKENKRLFGLLERKKEAIEKSFGKQLEWLLLPEKKSSRIQFGSPCEGYNETRWPEYIEWHIVHITKLVEAFRVHIDDLKRAQNEQTDTAVSDFQS